MTIDNTLQTAKTKIFYVVILVNIIALTAYNSFEHNRTWIEMGIWGLIVILGLTYLTMLYLKLNYFFMETKGEKLIIRFYAAHPIGRKYKSIEIPARAVQSFKIVKSGFGGLKKELYITVKTPKGMFNFPPLSITLLKSKDLQDIEYLLKPLSKR